MPLRLTLLSVATPEAFVEAAPSEMPLSVKVTLLPLTAVLAEVSVAERFQTNPLYVPDAASTESVVGATVDT